MKWFSSTFVILLISTFCLFVVLSAGSLLQARLGMTSPQSMRNMAQDISSPMMNTMLAMEVPQLRQQGDRPSLFQDRILSGIINYITAINPTDPWTIVASELPGLSGVEREEPSDRATDFEDPRTVDVEVDHDGMNKHEPDSESDSEFDSESETINEPAIGHELVTEPGVKNESDVENDAEAGTEIDIDIDTIKAFIYHSHNRESWVSELEGVTKHSDAFDAEINVTLLGDRLAERLQQLGIGAISSNTDYKSTIKDYNWNFSYAYSLKTVQEAFAVHEDLQYFFDLHRDAQKKSITTVEIDGVSYAKVYFVIGRKNPDWEKNEALAQQIHDIMEAQYPGISRGILGKNSNSGHAEYNQSFSANSILIEIGGVENTLEESYRTIDVLGSAISEVIWHAQKQ